MVGYRGKCAAKGCRHTRHHKSFHGRPEGRPIPNPCHIALDRTRPASDDRICTDCYDRHLAAVPERLSPELVTPQPSKRPRMSTPASESTLDGSFWHPPSTDRTAKCVIVIENGVQVIPLHEHVAKMEEAKLSERFAMNLLMEIRLKQYDELDEALGIEAIFRRDDLSNEDRANIIKRVIEYYKQKPSVKRARLLQDLTNAKAAALVGVSSKTDGEGAFHWSYSAQTHAISGWKWWLYA
jgi:hypothetical protein